MLWSFWSYKKNRTPESKESTIDPPTIEFRSNNAYMDIAKNEFAILAEIKARETVSKNIRYTRSYRKMEDINIHISFINYWEDTFWIKISTLLDDPHYSRHELITEYKIKKNKWTDYNRKLKYAHTYTRKRSSWKNYTLPFRRLNNESQQYRYKDNMSRWKLKYAYHKRKGL